MLKIKDNVDLKELEKFGFVKMHHSYEYDCGDNTSYICVYNKQYVDNNDEFFSNSEREIGLATGCYGDIPEIYFNDQLDILFDLIQAGLVEKVN